MSSVPDKHNVPEWLFEQESPVLYRQGGYRPTTVGERLRSDRYQIISKLGLGDQSTVWLATDRENRDVCVSVKIITADVSESAAKEREYPVLRHLNEVEAGRGHPGRDHIPRLIDTFWTESRYGTHFCIVSELLGINAHTIRDEKFDGRLPEFLLKRVLYDVLLALDYCHRVCGVIHTDLKIWNVLSCFAHEPTPRDPMISDVVPSTCDVHVLDESVVTFTDAAGVSDVPDQATDVEGWKKVRFKLIDFGTAHTCTGPNAWNEFGQYEITSRAGRSPEAWIGAPWNAATDIWSAGMVLLHLYSGLTILPEGWTGDMFPLAIYMSVGRFPPALLKKGELGHCWFDVETGDLREEFRELGIDQVSRYVRETCASIPPELNPLSEEGVDILERMLTVDPEQRPSAEELLQHAWFEEIRRFDASASSS